MDRRELLKMITLATGALVVGGEAFLTGCKTADEKVTTFTANEIALLDEVGETIIPATNTPGAKAAKVGEFMKTMVNDCYSRPEQKAFTEGMATLDKACKDVNGKTFMECTPQQRHDFLVTLEKEAKEHNDKNVTIDKSRRAEYENIHQKVPSKDQKDFESSPKHYYTLMKQLTLLGFFTSKTGMTETLRHMPVPGKYDGEYAYNKGDKAWAE